ncbi:hypothetical protein pb186bvf_010988 [Paramecium bursaria]
MNLSPSLICWLNKQVSIHNYKVDQQEFFTILTNIFQILIIQIVKVFAQHYLKYKQIPCELSAFIMNIVIYWYYLDSRTFTYIYISLILGQLMSGFIKPKLLYILLILCSMLSQFDKSGFSNSIEYLPIISVSSIFLLLMVNSKLNEEKQKQKQVPLVRQNTDTITKLHQKYDWLDLEQAAIFNTEFQIQYQYGQQFFISSNQGQDKLNALYLDSNNIEKSLKEHIEEIISEFTQSGVQKKLHIFNNQKSKQFLIIDNSFGDIFYLMFSRQRDAENLQVLYQVCQSISHELSTSLNSIIMLSSLQLENEQISQDQKQQYIDPILMNSKQLELILNNLKDYHSVVTNNFMMQISKFNLIQEIYEVISYFSYSIHSKKINLVVDNQLDISIIEGDKLRVKQIFYQLLSNSVRFTNKGQIVVTLKKSSINQIMISIKDQGIGMDENEKMRLSELLYQQIPQKISNNSTGCGLGLYITNILVKQLNTSKQIEFHSNSNEGSEFQFYLTLQNNIPSNDQSNRIRFFSSNTYTDNLFDMVSSQNFSPNVQTSQRIEMRKLRHRTFNFNSQQNTLLRRCEEDSGFLNLSDDESNHIIHPPLLITKPKFFNSPMYLKNIEKGQCCSKVLIVDDEYFNIYALMRMIQTIGSESDYAFNGQEAIEKIMTKQQCKVCNNNNYQLIFLDINMPIMDGIQTVKMIKELIQKKVKSDAICIANTAYSDLMTKQKAFDAGMDYYFTKPIDIQLLKQLIGKLFMEL